MPTYAVFLSTICSIIVLSLSNYVLILSPRFIEARVSRNNQALPKIGLLLTPFTDALSILYTVGVLHNMQP